MHLLSFLSHSLSLNLSLSFFLFSPSLFPTPYSIPLLLSVPSSSLYFSRTLSLSPISPFITL